MKLIAHTDLECTCFPDNEKPKDFFQEIIQIGVSIFDTNKFEIVDEIEVMVRPVLFPTLSQFCTTLTTITQEQVAKGLYIQEAFRQISKKVNPKTMVFTSWGKFDKNCVDKNVSRFRLVDPFPKGHINIKEEHTKFYKIRETNEQKIKKYFRNPKGMGTDKALEYHGLIFEGIPHTALDDSKNTTRILGQMIKDGWSHPLL